MYSISKEFHFSAAHKIEGLAKDHPCGRMHGHNYVVTFFLKSRTLDKNGFVMDFGELNLLGDWIKSHIDHRNLNEVFPKINPTSENLCKEFYDNAKEHYDLLYAVELKETDKTCCRYEP